MDSLLYIGKITGIFGIKGEMKLQYEELHPSDVLKKHLKIYINNNKYEIASVRAHKNNYLITIQGYENIDSIDPFLQKEVFVKRNELMLSNDKYFFSDLESCTIIDEEKEIGTVEAVLYNKAGILIKNDNLIIPLNEKYFNHIDIENKIIYVRNCKELML